MNLKKSISNPDEIVERMRQVRSSGFQRAVQLHDDAGRLFDWKEYARTRPLFSVAVVSMIGFGVVRMLTPGPNKSNIYSSSQRSIASQRPNSARMQIPSEWRTSVIAIVSQFAQESLKKYLLNLVQRNVSERTSHDQSRNSNPKA